MHRPTHSGQERVSDLSCLGRCAFDAPFMPPSRRIPEHRPREFLAADRPTRLAGVRCRVEVGAGTARSEPHAAPRRCHPTFTERRPFPDHSLGACSYACVKSQSGARPWLQDTSRAHSAWPPSGSPHSFARYRSRTPKPSGAMRDPRVSPRSSRSGNDFCARPPIPKLFTS